MKYIVFDANAFPRKGTSLSPFLQSFFALCENMHYVPAVPEVVKSEVLNSRKQDAKIQLDLLRDSYRRLSEYVDMPEMYFPEEGDAGRAVSELLENQFEILPLSGDAAREALHREANRRLPAREGRGSRDSAIWLTLVELAVGGHQVAFISNNSLDFGKGKLHPSLAEELSDASGSIEYFHTPYAFLSEKAEPFDIELLNEAHAIEAFRGDIVERLPDLIVDRYDSWENAASAVEGCSLAMRNVVFTQGYSIDGGVVAHCSGLFDLTNRPGDEVVASGQFSGVVVLEEEVLVAAESSAESIRVD